MPCSSTGCFPWKRIKHRITVTDRVIDNKACLDMSSCIAEGGVAEIFVEETMSYYNSEESDWETDNMKSDEMENVEGTQYDANKEGSVGEDSDTTDSDYQPESGNSSADDE
ncbi:hypothetical protein OsJ_26788 [Oryza sativa Japonica Group]|uniref:Uncharacterized protein n=1 Tax=Oryza sativa subsp. japonica TaxID=39947 RepID=B9G056_ORYSJ|nr:hypothetical protein OsJ_26788 [Oryza sativa Japonica Group]KAF2919044.1 hypothetical protein DAI22_08g105250 [Oryza sativa Japonica Group]